MNFNPASLVATAGIWRAALWNGSARLLARTGWGIRGKLIAIFVVIKVLPLVLLGGFAWTQSERLGELLALDANRLTQRADRAVNDVGQLAVADSMKALNTRMREEIERQTTDVARRIAIFLLQRDDDIRYAGSLAPDQQVYRTFLEGRIRNITTHGRWELAADGSHWQPVAAPVPAPQVTSSLTENDREFHYRPPDSLLHMRSRPLYLEMTFVGTDGREKVKVSTSPRLAPGLRDVSRRENTYTRAETYFADLKRLKPGEIYVSEVIGPYVGSPIIGHYTPAAAARAGIAFAPEKAAYAGKENPLGRRFEGLVRWAMPVVRDGRIIGYVTLALDHDHLMEFTNTLMPTAERYTDIPDAGGGNYAYVWDHLGRSIVHPRHHTIVGYRPATGEPEIPWLDAGVDEARRKSGKSDREFMRDLPLFHEQSYRKTPSPLLKQEARVGIDCRYANFAPQCTGWFELTQHGGSGSFIIAWSGLSKLVTAAAIPYYTGQYARSPRGFGMVTIGANVDEFYRPASESKLRIDQMISAADQELSQLEAAAQKTVVDNVASTTWSLGVSTFLMCAMVIVIAVWMASFLTGHIRKLIGGISRFRQGEADFRFHSRSADEMGALADSFDAMADAVNTTLSDLRREISEHLGTAGQLRSMQAHLEQLVAQRTSELSLANQRLHEEVQERRSAEETALHLALHDPLTDLPNRRQFHDRLQQALLHCSRKRIGNALLYFDLDRFKSVNDTLGHETGDALLLLVADAMRHSVREIDLIARLGGDEFAILLVDIDSPADCARVASSLLSRLNGVVEVLGHPVPIGISIGAVYFDDNHATLEQLLRHADHAMYQAKQSGGNTYQFFADEPASAAAV